MSITNRYDFVYLFDVREGNPNGDPDAGNLPRIDPETGHGIVTDVCLKRKVRNHVGLHKKDEPPYEIYVKERAVLNHQHKRAYVACDVESKAKSLPSDQDKAREITKWMCANFYDIRTFGAVMTTDVNCGQVRGPVQIAFAHSIDPIVTLEHSITRMAVTTEKESQNQDGANRTMGRKYTVPYGLYRAHGFISPAMAEHTDFSEDDLKLFWEALESMFESDRSASRGEMSARKLVVFKHDSKLGNAPAHTLFERVTVVRKDETKPPRDYSDYSVLVNREGMPPGVVIEEPFE